MAGPGEKWFKKRFKEIEVIAQAGKLDECAAQVTTLLNHPQITMYYELKATVYLCCLAKDLEEAEKYLDEAERLLEWAVRAIRLNIWRPRHRDYKRVAELRMHMFDLANSLTKWRNENRPQSAMKAFSCVQAEDAQRSSSTTPRDWRKWNDTTFPCRKKLASVPGGFDVCLQVVSFFRKGSRSVVRRFRTRRRVDRDQDGDDNCYNDWM